MALRADPMPVNMPNMESNPHNPAALIEATAARSRRFTTPCAEGELVWRRWGEGSPLVLLHGGTGSWMHWIRNVLHFAPKYTVWVPDMPGYGESAAPPKGSDLQAVTAIVAQGLK